MEEQFQRSGGAQQTAKNNAIIVVYRPSYLDKSETKSKKYKHKVVKFCKVFKTL